MRKENVHETLPGRCWFSVLNVSWFLSIPVYGVFSEADSPEQMHPLPVLLLPEFQMAVLLPVSEPVYL